MDLFDQDNFSVGNTSGSFSAGSRVHRRISVSPVFHPTTLSDLPLLSSNSVVFYTSSQTILQASNNRFAGLIPPVPTDTNNRYDFVHVPGSYKLACSSCWYRIIHRVIRSVGHHPSHHIRHVLYPHVACFSIDSYFPQLRGPVTCQSVVCLHPKDL